MDDFVEIISVESALQTSFIDYTPEQREKLRRLDEALGHINRLYGSETIVLGAQQYTAPDINISHLFPLPFGSFRKFAYFCSRI